ncbi:hypothetical protein [Castellaniella defragrans]
MYFTDVVDALSPPSWISPCTAAPLDAVESVNLSPDAQTFLGSIGHPIFA